MTFCNGLKMLNLGYMSWHLSSSFLQSKECCVRVRETNPGCVWCCVDGPAFCFLSGRCAAPPRASAWIICARHRLISDYFIKAVTHPHRAGPIPIVNYPHCGMLLLVYPQTWSSSARFWGDCTSLIFLGTDAGKKTKTFFDAEHATFFFEEFAAMFRSSYFLYTFLSDEQRFRILMTWWLSGIWRRAFQTLTARTWTAAFQKPWFPVSWL